MYQKNGVQKGNCGSIVSLLQVPSGYFLADCFLYLDALMRRRLFRPQQDECRSTLAAKEGCKAKACIGSLRYLWRNSPGGAHDSNVAKLKELLVVSPLQGKRRTFELAAADEGDEEQGDQDPDAADADYTSDEAGSDPESEDVRPASLVRTPEQQVVEAEEPSPVPVAGSTSESEQERQELIRANTIQLGYEDVDEPMDSQVSSGWLGKFYSSQGFTKSSRELKRHYRETLLCEIREFLREEDSLLEEYLDC